MIEKIYGQFEKIWDEEVQPALTEFIKLPALSPDFDSEWEKTGLLQKAVNDAKLWADSLKLKGFHSRIVKDEGHSPCLLVQIDASEDCKGKSSVFLYGHLDKQPANNGWDQDKGAWKPVVQNGRLYGRGGADDGYSFFCTLGVIKALQKLGIAHPRCVGLFETCEESGSVHYPEYLEKVKEELGGIGLVIALDSCCGDYGRLWITESLRGMIGGALEVRVLKAGVHSGEASGIVPSSFMILRNLLDRLEDSSTGRIKPEFFHTSISPEALAQNKDVADLLGSNVCNQYPFVEGCEPLTKDPVLGLLNRNWEPELTVTGMDGIPSVADGGNVMREFTRAKLGIRLPPDINAVECEQKFRDLITSNPPFKAQVSFKPTVRSDGWVSPKRSSWLVNAFSMSSRQLWGQDVRYLGMGGSIPLLNVFSQRWSKAQYMVAGVLGPQANAHGPNEFLDIEFVKKLSTTVAFVIKTFGEEQEA